MTTLTTPLPLPTGEGSGCGKQGSLVLQHTYLRLSDGAIVVGEQHRLHDASAIDLACLETWPLNASLGELRTAIKVINGKE